MIRKIAAGAFSVLLLAGLVFAQAEPQAKILPRWKWRKGDIFTYQLRGDVVSPGGTAQRSIVSSTITISARGSASAVFSNIYAEIRWREKDEWYNATEEGLKEHSFGLVMDRAGKVQGEDKNALAGPQEFLDGIMPLPRGPVAAGSFWKVDMKRARLQGTCEFTGFGEYNGRKCAIFRMELASTERVDKKPARELTATLYFDHGEGCFVRIERRLETRGEKPRDERLTVDLLSSPKSPSAAVTEDLLMENLLRRLKRNPKDVPVMRQLAQHYGRLGKYDDAHAMLDGILKVSPEDPQALTKKGDIVLVSGDAAGALKWYKKALTVDANYSPALLGSARAAFAVQKYADCVRYARLSLSEDEKHPYQAYYLLGSALAKLGRKEDAVKCLKRYIELNPTIDKSKEPTIAFTKDNDVRLVVRRLTPPVDIEKRLKYTPEELAEGRELVKVLVKEEAVRLKLASEEIERFLDYMAELYGKKVPKMVADFIADREKTYRKLKAALDKQIKLPAGKLRKAAEAGALQPAAMEAILSMLEPQDALKRLETLVTEHPTVARYHYLLGRYCLATDRSAKRALMRFELAAMFDEKNALYRYATAFASLKLHNQARMFDELTAAVSLKRFDTGRRAVARERLNALQKLGYSERFRKVTAWTSTEDAEVRMVKAVLDAAVGIARKDRQKKLYDVSQAVAELVYFLTLQLANCAPSVLMLVTARSEREAALGLLEGLYVDAAADKNEPRRQEYAGKLPEVRKKLTGLEKENLVYLKAYVRFLKRCEQAFQVEPVTAPARSGEFMDRLMQGELEVFKKEVSKVSSELKGKD